MPTWASPNHRTCDPPITLHGLPPGAQPERRTLCKYGPTRTRTRANPHDRPHSGARAKPSASTIPRTQSIPTASTVCRTPPASTDARSRTRSGAYPQAWPRGTQTQPCARLIPIPTASTVCRTPTTGTDARTRPHPGGSSCTRPADPTPIPQFNGYHRRPNAERDDPNTQPTAEQE